MKNTLALLLAMSLILSGCATQIPHAVSCPPPAPLPSVLKEPVSTGPSLSLRFEDSLNALKDSLTKAARP